MTSINDKPSYYDDQLNYRKYAKALAKVIKDADTPFTIGISWEWWYGKTTLMHLIAYYLDKNYYEDNKNYIKSNLKLDISDFYRNEWIKKWDYNIIFLDTWPFINSQDIWESIFEQVMYELIKVIKKNENVFKGVWKFLLKTIWATIKSVKFSWKLKLAWFGEIWADFDPSKFSMDDMFLTDNIYKNFKIEIEEIFNEITKKLWWKLIIFIDDLDRLTPKQALEVILFMKNFLDIKNCIFIIWTDNEVLKEWLEELYWKYWNDKDKEWREKYLKQIKNNFFEKIYQLEFKIPLISYTEIDEYISQFSDFNDNNIRTNIINMLKDVIPTMNLRKIKKIMNTYYLIKQLWDVNSITMDMYDVFRVSIIQNTSYFKEVKYKLIYGEYNNEFQEQEKLNNILNKIGFSYNSPNIQVIFSILGSKPKSEEEILWDYIDKFITSSSYNNAEINYAYLANYLQNTNLQNLSDKYLAKLIDGIQWNIIGEHNQILEANRIGDNNLKQLIEQLAWISLKADIELINKIDEFIKYLQINYENLFTLTIEYLNEIKNNINPLEDDDIPF